tara:strand:- start:3053 stop:3448 length:396 start_codon:yes stop_codon:yes gene_type:complete
MSQDLKYIKKKLENCEEIEDLFELKRGDRVKYITLDKGSEFFYDGGEYIRMIDNALCIQCGNQNKNVTISYFNKDGGTLYNTRFFVETKECITKKETDEFEKIIKNQQKIIEVLTKKNKVLERELKKYKSQ